jgi:hypothetical protein
MCIARSIITENYFPIFRKINFIVKCPCLILINGKNAGSKSKCNLIKIIFNEL